MQATMVEYNLNHQSTSALSESDSDASSNSSQSSVNSSRLRGTPLDEQAPTIRDDVIHNSYSQDSTYTASQREALVQDEYKALLETLDPPMSRLELFRDTILRYIDHPLLQGLGVLVVLSIIVDGALFFFLLCGWHRMCDSPSKTDCEPRNWWYNLSIQLLNVFITYINIFSFPWRISNFVHITQWHWCLGCFCPKRNNQEGCGLYGMPNDPDIWFHIPLKRRLGITCFLLMNNCMQFINHSMRLRYNTFSKQSTWPGNFLTSIFFITSFTCAGIGACWTFYEIHQVRKKEPDRFHPGPIAILKQKWTAYQNKRRSLSADGSKLRSSDHGSIRFKMNFNLSEEIEEISLSQSFRKHHHHHDKHSDESVSSYPSGSSYSEDHSNSTHFYNEEPPSPTTSSLSSPRRRHGRSKSEDIIPIHPPLLTQSQNSSDNHRHHHHGRSKKVNYRDYLLRKSNTIAVPESNRTRHFQDRNSFFEDEHEDHHQSHDHLDYTYDNSHQTQNNPHISFGDVESNVNYAANSSTNASESRRRKSRMMSYPPKRKDSIQSTPNHRHHSDPTGGELSGTSSRRFRSQSVDVGASSANVLADVDVFFQDETTSTPPSSFPPTRRRSSMPHNFHQGSPQQRPHYPDPTRDPMHRHVLGDSTDRGAFRLFAM